MQIRFITQDDKLKTTKLLSVYDSTNFDIDMKLLHYMKSNEIPVCVNQDDIAEGDVTEYIVEDISYIVPKLGGELLPAIEVILV